MKLKIRSYRYLLLIILTMITLLFSCGKSGDTAPGLSIYKTRGDYFLYVNTWGTDNAPTDAKPDGGRYGLVIDSDTINNFRKMLIDGYVLGEENTVKDYFTDMTFNEIVNYYEKTGEVYFPLDSIFERVIDYDPYIEFYYDINRPRKFELTDTAKINKIIRDGELEKYFKRLK